jgi:pilus assembly protein Flp/PilA
MNLLKKLYDTIGEKLFCFFGYLRSEKGQTVVEYALLLVLIAIVVIVMVTGVGKSANNAYSEINSALN